MAHFSVPTRRLRYALTLHLHDVAEPTTIGELADAMLEAGIDVAGRPSKVISDALRTEVSRGRVLRLGRGTYRAGVMPESTGRYLRRWLAEH